MECYISDEVLKICRVCMADSSTEVVQNKLKCSFLDITGIQTYHDALKDNLALALCVECQDNFAKCLKFREDAQKTNAALCELKRHGKLTRHHIFARTNSLDIEFCDLRLGLTINQDDHIKLEKCEEDDEIDSSDSKFVKLENQECSKEIQNKEKQQSLQEIFNSEDSNTELDITDHDEPIYLEFSDDDKPLFTELPMKRKNTKTKAVRKKAVAEQKKEKTVKKNHTSKDPTSQSYDRFSYLLKHFDFSVLKETELRDEFEKRKLDESYLRSKYKCVLCYRGFKFKETYDRHIEQKHAMDPTRPHKCELCSAFFATKKFLQDHMRLHSELYQCRLCDYVTEQRKAARLHISWHEGKVYKCKHCPKTFRRPTTLFNHQRTSHAAECVCADCGFSFAGPRGLQRHRQLRHAHADRNKSTEDGPLCKECNIKFVSEKALHIHWKISPKHTSMGNRLRNDANAIKPKELYEVDSASKSESRADVDVIDPNNAIKRQRGKLRDQGLRCEKCGEPQTSFYSYKRHFSIAHYGETRTLFPSTSNQVLCDHCGKVFVSKAYLREHMNTHTKATVVHRQTNLAGKYPCKLCGKIFTWCSNRDRHAAYVHLNVKNVKCVYCDKYFKSPKEQKDHIEHVHHKKPWPKRVRNKDGHRIINKRERD